jgi:hypothetical protein
MLFVPRDREAAREAKGSSRLDRPLTGADGGRLVSFLVSFMFVYLRPSPSTTPL